MNAGLLRFVLQFIANQENQIPLPNPAILDCGHVVNLEPGLYGYVLDQGIFIKVCSKCFTDNIIETSNLHCLMDEGYLLEH